MNETVVGITGANGFVGSMLTNALILKGNKVIRLVRTLAALPDTEVRMFELGTPPSAHLLAGIDILIHCAFVSPTEKNAASLDYAGTAALVQLARKSGVKKIIFFSSVSAHAQATSSYGTSKFKMEQLMDPQRDAIVKPALIVGDGGLFARLLKQALLKRTIPLIENGKQPMQVIALEDVVRAVDIIIDRGLTGSFILANHDQFSYKEMFRQIATVYGVTFRFIPLPVFPVRMALTISERMGVKLPVNKENLTGLQSLRYMDPAESMQILGIHPKGFQEALIGIKKLNSEGK